MPTLEEPAQALFFPGWAVRSAANRHRPRGHDAEALLERLPT
jgi:hypothetical protein